MEGDYLSNQIVIRKGKECVFTICEISSQNRHNEALRLCPLETTVNGDQKAASYGPQVKSSWSVL